MKYWRKNCKRSKVNGEMNVGARKRTRLLWPEKLTFFDTQPDTYEQPLCTRLPVNAAGDALYVSTPRKLSLESTICHKSEIFNNPKYKLIFSKLNLYLKNCQITDLFSWLDWKNLRVLTFYMILFLQNVTAFLINFPFSVENYSSAFKHRCRTYVHG